VQARDVAVRAILLGDCPAGGGRGCERYLHADSDTVFTTIFKLAPGSFTRALACYRVSDSGGVGTATALSAVFIASLVSLARSESNSKGSQYI
jgi:hypothetical protein